MNMQDFEKAVGLNEKIQYLKQKAKIMNDTKMKIKLGIEGYRQEELEKDLPGFTEGVRKNIYDALASKIEEMKTSFESI